MKKLTPFLVLLILIVALGSCTQEYICQCVVKYSGKPPGIPDSAVHEFTIRDKKKDAAKLCEENSVSSSNNGITMDEKCRLY
jgi:hypothetical protein